MSEPDDPTDNGDDAALSFEALHRRYESKIHDVLLRMVRDEDVAEDLTVETFVRAWRGWGERNQAQPSSTWLHHLALDAAKEHFRRKHEQRLAHGEVLDVGNAENVSRADHSRYALMKMMAIMTMTAPTDWKIWQNPEVARRFSDRRRGGLLGGDVQLETLLRLVSAAPAVAGKRGGLAVLDLGCGDGVLLETLLAAFPNPEMAVALDGSAAMLERVGERLAGRENVSFVLADFNEAIWRNKLPTAARAFDVIVSGFAIHHSEDARKRELYAEIFGLLAPGGVFVNVEHVASATPLGEQFVETAYAENLLRFRREEQSEAGLTLDDVLAELRARPDKTANRLAPVETQLGWLREAGFTDVDCYWKHFELAVLAGYKPTEERPQARMANRPGSTTMTDATQTTPSSAPATNGAAASISDEDLMTLVERYLEPHQPADYRIGMVRHEGVRRSGNWHYIVVRPSHSDVLMCDYNARLEKNRGGAGARRTPESPARAYSARLTQFYDQQQTPQRDPSRSKPNVNGCQSFL